MRIRALTAALAILFARSGYSAKDSCFECHSVVEGTSVVFKDDIHYRNGISCAGCHGGDANEDDQNISMSAQRGTRKHPGPSKMTGSPVVPPEFR